MPFGALCRTMETEKYPYQVLILTEEVPCVGKASLRKICMNEVKKPRKPLLFYYTIVLVIMLLFNLIAMPKLMSRQIQEVD